MALIHLALIFLVLTFGQQAAGENASMNRNTNLSPKLYGGKTADQWISEVLHIALTVRTTEETYEKSLRECVRLRKSVDDKAPSCIRANDSRFAAESARNEYQRLLNEAAATSLPPEWLRAHFTWVRWGPEWKRN